jgi:hypothetical protein
MSAMMQVSEGRTIHTNPKEELCIHTNYTPWSSANYKIMTKWLLGTLLLPLTDL